MHVFQTSHQRPLVSIDQAETVQPAESEQNLAEIPESMTEKSAFFTTETIHTITGLTTFQIMQKFIVQLLK